MNTTRPGQAASAPGSGETSEGLRKRAVAIAAGYALTAGLWILFSDKLLTAVVADHARIESFSIAKGWGFVAVTAVLLYVLIHRAFQRIAAATEAVAQNRALLQSVIDGTSDAVFVKDLAGRYLLFNTAAGRMVGKSPSAVIGYDDTALFSESDARAIRGIDSRVLEAGCTRTAEEEVVLADGTRHVLLATKGPVRDEFGNVTGLFGIARDITPRKRAEEELVRTRQLAEAASRAKTDFLANMSHEMRTPLAGTLGMLDLALETKLNREQRELLETSRRCAGSLLRLITDVLNFSALEAGKITLECRAFDLRRCVTAASDSSAVQARRKGLELTCTIDDRLPAEIMGDDGRIMEVLMNLMENAVKFTHRGRIGVDVTTACDHELGGEMVVFSVRDTGIGIAVDDLQVIFERFTQVDTSNTRSYGGMGLGLALAKGIVEKMGGKMWVESIQGTGSTFYFTVPLKVCESVPRDAAQGVPAA